MKTFSAKKEDIKRNWHIIDAKGLILGRMAVEVVKKLRGKDKPYYTPHMDCGDNVIIINAEKIVLTGKKKEQKVSFWHTGYPGGIKERTAGEYILRKPEEMIRNAITRMIPKGPLGRQQLKKLHIYKGDCHPHLGQKPSLLNIAGQNRKNSSGEN